MKVARVGPFGSPCVPPWVPLGPPWVPLRSPLGPLWVPLGHRLRPLGSPLGALGFPWVPLGPLGSPWVRPWVPLGPPLQIETFVVVAGGPPKCNFYLTCLMFFSETLHFTSINEGFGSPWARLGALGSPCVPLGSPCVPLGSPSGPPCSGREK